MDKMNEIRKAECADYDDMVRQDIRAGRSYVICAEDGSPRIAYRKEVIR